jgi:hypothetical protein
MLPRVYKEFLGCGMLSPGAAFGKHPADSSRFDELGASADNGNDLQRRKKMLESKIVKVDWGTPC